jgi:uncharacterized protein DUF4926
MKEFDVVALVRELQEIPIPASATGTALMVFPDHPTQYEVEFSDEKGGFFPGTYTISEEDLTLVWEYDCR